MGEAGSPTIAIGGFENAKKTKLDGFDERFRRCHFLYTIRENEMLDEAVRR
jgi:hypothetical protein